MSKECVFLHFCKQLLRPKMFETIENTSNRPKYVFFLSPRLITFKLNIDKQF